MQTSTLNDLMEIYVEGPPIASFCPDAAIELWWNDCTTTRRVDQHPREVYSQRNPTTLPETNTQEQDSEEQEDNLVLEMWDDWFNSDTEPEDPSDND